MRSALVRSFALFAFVVFARSAAAGTIGLTGGSIDVSGFPGGPTNLVGDRRFTFNGGVHIAGSPDTCFSGVCLPGTPVDLHLLASGGDVHGSGTLDGIPYTLSTVTGSDMIIHIEGEFIAPPHGSDDTVTVVEPVTWISQGPNGSSLIFSSPNTVETVRETLVGSAIATTTLNFLADPHLPQNSGWTVDHITYDIAATPEPSSLLLLGSGLVGLVGRRAWRKRRDSASAIR